jgi:hypothetical protein
MFKPLHSLAHIAPDSKIRFSFNGTPVTVKVIKVDWFEVYTIQKLAVWCHKLDPLFELETWPNNHDRIVSFVEPSGIEIETDSVLKHLTTQKQNLEAQLQETNSLIEYYQS